MSELIAEIESFIRRDPAGRGLISSEAARGPLCAGHLQAAADELAARATAAAIVTGFYIPHAHPPAAETDGPPGAALLAATFHGLGVECWLVTDEPCASAVRAATRAVGLPEERVLVAPLDAEAWIDAFWAGPVGSRLSHLISIERVGKSHTPDSLARQQRSGPPPLVEFLKRVPEASRDRSHNMRARIIDDWTADLGRLFERGKSLRPELRTIGIGDGGNEIGMGAIPWEELVARLDRENSAHIPCRIATDWVLVAGTSNWGGWALAAAVCWKKNRLDVLRPFTVDQQERALVELVQQGPAVDGIVGQPEATVDGLPFITYIQPWVSMRQRLGLPV